MVTQPGRKTLILALTVLIGVLFVTPAFADAEDNAAYYGIFTILPPLVAIALAFITKNVMLSLFTGAFTGCFMMEFRSGGFIASLGNGFIGLMDEVIASMSDPWNAGILLQVLAIGSMIALMTRLGGVRAVAEAMSKFAKTARSTQIVSWIMGFFIFFDDYANALTVGPVMRPVTDKMRISREKLAFLVDGTAAPIAGMALISTWVAYEIGTISSALEQIEGSFLPYMLFIESLPFRFYNILVLAFIFISNPPNNPVV